MTLPTLPNAVKWAAIHDEQSHHPDWPFMVAVDAARLRLVAHQQTVRTAVACAALRDVDGLAYLDELAEVASL